MGGKRAEGKARPSCAIVAFGIGDSDDSVAGGGTEGPRSPRLNAQLCQGQMTAAAAAVLYRYVLLLPCIIRHRRVYGRANTKLVERKGG